MTHELKQGTSVKKMVQGQLKEETKLSIIRENGHHFDTATYIMAGGFRIVATKYGVTFAGSCTSLSSSQIKQFKLYVTRASKISEELKAGRGLVPEAEFNGLRLRGRKVGDQHVAWYEGESATNVQHTDAATAVRTLRINRISLHGASTK